MKKSYKTFGSRFAEFLKKENVPFEIFRSDSERTFFKISGILTNKFLFHFSVRLPYWQVFPFDSTSFLFVVFEKF